MLCPIVRPCGANIMSVCPSVRLMSTYFTFPRNRSICGSSIVADAGLFARSSIVQMFQNCHISVTVKISQHSDRPSRLSVFSASSSGTEIIKFPSFLLADHTPITAFSRSLRASWYLGHSNMKCYTSSIPCSHSHTPDCSSPHLCWCAFSIK